MTASNAAAVTPDSPLPAGKTGGRGDSALIRFLIAQRFSRQQEFATTTHAVGIDRAHAPGDLVDYLFRAEDQPHTPDDVFDRLRWGGQFIYASRDWKKVSKTIDQFADWREAKAWALERRPQTLKKYPFNLRILGIHRNVHFLVARKVLLVKPGESTDRFTYNVYLDRSSEGEGCEVVKEVPTFERVLSRLREKFPDADTETLKRRAKKFTERIFPVFLTREAAILKLLQRDLPAAFKDRVPRVITAEQDLQGYVRTLRMNWLRNGRAGKKPLTQLEFAKQSAELLTALHDDAHVMHLDLRLDNFVITEKGVGFVDFGSAVRVGEAFPEASLLGSLFGEMMRTSQIQRMLGKMTESGHVTSEEIRNSYHRIDKAVDFFYLAVQINAPHSNPDFKGLIAYDKDSEEANALSILTEQILRPDDTHNATFKSARDILNGILEIEKRLGKRR